MQKGVTDTTIHQIAERLVDAINSQSSYLTATRNNDNSVKVVIKDRNNVGNFIVTGNMAVVRSYMPVYATSTTYSSKESLANQITLIRSSTLGWLGVTNPYYIFGDSSSIRQYFNNDDVYNSFINTIGGEKKAASLGIRFGSDGNVLIMA